jgi:hypothetical protein
MLWVIKPKINTKATLMLFGNPHCGFRQGTKTLSATGKCIQQHAGCRERSARVPPIAPILGTTVAALESDGAAASDYIFLRTASAWL